MKQVILIISFLFCWSISGYSQGGDPPPRGSGRVQSPVEVILNTSNIEVQFLQDLGNVTVNVVSETGINVYENTVYAIAGSNLIIDSSQYPYATYTIRITNAEGVLIKSSLIVLKE